MNLSPGANSNEKITKVTVRFLDVLLDNAGYLPAVESVRKMDCHQHSVIELYSHNKIIRSYKTWAEKINQQSIVPIVCEHLDFFMKQLIMGNLQKAEVLP
jgi:nitrogenase subunit NifH